jgi:hypothetical protein
MEAFESYDCIISYQATRDESTLTFRDEQIHQGPQPVNQALRNYLIQDVAQGYRPVVFEVLSIIVLRNKSNNSIV